HMRAAIGHKLAAQAVRMVGNRLAGLLPGCTLGRVSNDVLGFVLEAEDEARALETAGRLLAALEQPVQVGGEAVDVALSIGLAPLGADGAGQAIERAVVGLDQARAARRKAAVFDAEAYGD